MKKMTNLKKFNEMEEWDLDGNFDNPLSTVGQLINYLKKFDENTKVAVNVAEEPSEILEIVETTVGRCTGRGDSLSDTAGWSESEKVILIKGNQY
jgi:hypothetical protein